MESNLDRDMVSTYYVPIYFCLAFYSMFSIMCYLFATHYIQVLCRYWCSDFNCPVLMRLVHASKGLMFRKCL